MIPPPGAWSSQPGSAARQLAQRLAQALPEGYLVWAELPLGPKSLRPACVLLHPDRGLLLLELRPWKRDLLQHATREYWELLAEGRNRVVINPAAQAKHAALQAVQALEADPALVLTEGRHRGKLAFPWGWGVALTGMTRRQFNAAGLDNVMPAHLALCQDELAPEVGDEALQRRIDVMFCYGDGRRRLGPQEVDRVRWRLFPHARLQPPAPDDGAAQVLDLQQEQLALAAPPGHELLVGAAGSGKTMILRRRAELLARQPVADPVLVLCLGEALAAELRAGFALQGLAGRIQVHTFAQWCAAQLASRGLPGASSRQAMKLADALAQAIERGQVPREQYQAVLVDEAHGFAGPWLQLAAQQIGPGGHLLLLHDPLLAEVPEPAELLRLGVDARLHRLAGNRRSPAAVQQALAALLLQLDAAAAQQGAAPPARPTDGGSAAALQRIQAPTLWDEAFRVADLLAQARADGLDWRQQAVLCRRPEALAEFQRVLAARGLPLQLVAEEGGYDPDADGIRLLPLALAAGLEFSLVVLSGLPARPEPGGDPLAEARLAYQAATRARGRLVLTSSGEAGFPAGFGPG